MIVKLNYLVQTTRPDIMYVVHSCAKYSSDPHQEHSCAVLDTGMYLKTYCTLSLKFKPEPSKGFEDFVDANFAGLWNNIEAPTDPITAKSHAG